MLLGDSVDPTRSAAGASSLRFWYLACSSQSRYQRLKFEDVERENVMTTRLGSARVGLALLLTVITGCAGVPPHLELPALDIKQRASSATLGAYAGAPSVGGHDVQRG